ncbi:hypothetical protein T01_4223 [Trichinella spiralis]|uniref:Uncharacterized protein n=1 Tax=Trichinella spiralis TaxID=6334 RepID=A0A0V1B3N2_TRISP|nr:hypothetical protein T01_4223 [Trichinella spiralis]
MCDPTDPQVAYLQKSIMKMVTSITTITNLTHKRQRARFFNLYREILLITLQTECTTNYPHACPVRRGGIRRSVHPGYNGQMLIVMVVVFYKEWPSILDICKITFHEKHIYLINIEQC